ncbi:MAG: AarF/UbiB family protein [Acidobacteriota bacterium]
MIRPAPPAPAIDRRRYTKLRRFVLGVLLQAFLHDLLLNRRGLRSLRRDPLPRWVAVTRRFRALALELGGVLIKVGQFLSARVDVLPPEVTSELAGLQDKVPPGPFEGIVGRVEESFGRPLSEVFARFDEEPLGAASLAQVHAATRADSEAGAGTGSRSGETVVVKVLRPGIEVLVETDLSAVAFAVRWLKWSKRIRRRVDLDRLEQEIAKTTRAELDMRAEGANAERFGEMFADSPAITVPRVIWETTTGDVLTLEKIEAPKIDDLDAMAAAGIDRTRVAATLFHCYLDQVLVHQFVHADPHPGNVFVRPAPDAPDGFELVFVDFGMIATVPERLRASLSEYVIALATRDARRMVRSYQRTGVLLPGADLERLEALHEDVFERLWGIEIGAMRDVAFDQAGYFFRRYRSLIYEMPFQVQVELLFSARAMGILAGVTTRLDPRFDFWSEAIPVAERLARRELWQALQEAAKGLPDSLRAAALLPRRIERFLDEEDERRQSARQAEPSAIGRNLPWAILSAASLLAGAIARLGDDPAAAWFFGLAGGAFLVSRLRR